MLKKTRRLSFSSISFCPKQHISGTVFYHVIGSVAQTEVGTQLSKLHRTNMLFSKKQRHHPIRCLKNLMLHISHSPLCIKWHMADKSLWYLSLSPCIMFFIVPNFQQLDLINPGKTQRAQGSLNNWSDWACSLAASLPNIRGNHNKIENTVCPCLLVCLCTSYCSLWSSATKSIA